MVDKKFREAIDAWGQDHEVEVKILDSHAYDRSVVGVTEEGRLVYSYEKMIQEYMEDEDCTEEEAIEWIDYNTVRAVGYFENGPIIIHDIESIKEIY